MTSTFKICREHFTQQDFEGPTTLRPNAVPSLFTIHSRSLMNKQNLNDTNSSSVKRFRSDIRAKQIIPMNNKRLQQLSYRNNIHHYEQQFHSPSPINEHFDENIKQIFNETKPTIIDIDLNMNCMEEKLSDIQQTHCPVKVNRILFFFLSIFFVLNLGSRSSRYKQWSYIKTT